MPKLTEQWMNLRRKGGQESGKMLSKVDLRERTRLLYGEKNSTRYSFLYLYADTRPISATTGYMRTSVRLGR